jgi:hypothetical protein
MLSLTVFGLGTGMSYLMYRNRTSTHEKVVSAADVATGGSGTRYVSGFLQLGFDPVTHNHRQMVSLNTKLYNVYQRLHVVDGSAFTETTDRFENSNLQTSTIYLNDTDVTTLVPKFHSNFANKLGETYEVNAPSDLYNTTLQLGSFRLNSQNEVLTGIRRRFYGLPYDPNTQYKFYEIIVKY